ncbi:MAG: cyclic nucleotide-binding domain-containing protein [Myxococcales bacterium]
MGASGGDLGLLAKNPLLGRLAPQELELFLGFLEEVCVPVGGCIVREGEPSDAMYFVLEGTARMDRRGIELGGLGAGDHFGELGLIGQGPRAASVHASTSVRLGLLSPVAYGQMLGTHPGIAAHFLQGLVMSLGERLVAMTDNVGVLLRERSVARRTEVTVRVDGGTRVVPTGTPVSSVLPSVDSDGEVVVAGLSDGKPVSLGTGLG